MSNLIYPALPGLTLDVKRTPIHKTLSRESVSGIDITATYQAYPRYLITLKYEVLRAGELVEKQKLEGFFNARHGAFDDFLFLDSKDNACVDQQFGIGDGVTKTFRLTRSLVTGGLQEPISALLNAPVIKHNGAVQGTGSYTVDQFAGKITYATAPALGVVLTWGGQYYWRVRFARDELQFDQFLWDLWKLDKVELQTVKTR
jgi:uncharacterized protein (TIGR02217 family)